MEWLPLRVNRNASLEGWAHYGIHNSQGPRCQMSCTQSHCSQATSVAGLDGVALFLSSVVAAS